MDIQGAIRATMEQLPALGLGFLGGMLFMRGSYMKMLRWLKTMVARQQHEINRMRNRN